MEHKILSLNEMEIRLIKVMIDDFKREDFEFFEKFVLGETKKDTSINEVIKNLESKIYLETKSKSSHLEKLKNKKVEDTENKIKKSIEELKKENEKLSLINISKKSNVSYTTIKKYKSEIEEWKKDNSI